MTGINGRPGPLEGANTHLAVALAHGAEVPPLRSLSREVEHAALYCLWDDVVDDGNPA